MEKKLTQWFYVTCHGLGNFPHLYKSPNIHLWIFETLWFIISWLWVICKRLNVNWIKNCPVILSVTCHSIRNFPHSYSSPNIHSWIFETLQLIIYWVWVICKRLNVNWKKNDSVILSVTCHSLRNFPPLIHPLISICEFSKPYNLLFLKFKSFIKGWM